MIEIVGSPTGARQRDVEQPWYREKTCGVESLSGDLKSATSVLRHGGTRRGDAWCLDKVRGESGHHGRESR